MRYFGYYAPEHLGGTCPQITGTGRIPIRRFCRWRDRGVWEKLLAEVIDEPDFEWLMIDASHIKVHPHARLVPEGEIRKWPTQKGG